MHIRSITAAMLLTAALCGAEPVIHKVGIKENQKFLDEGRNERMDLYYPADPQPGEKFPGIVIIHGGGWTSGIRNAAREINIGSNLARMGYVCISIDYRLATTGNLKKYGKTFPVNVQDCKTAVQWLRVNAEKLHVDPAKIGCIGGSAGGHLAAMLATAGPDVGLDPQAPYPGIDSSVQACVNLYGVSDFTWDPKKLKKNRTLVMGSTPKTDLENWKRMSPIHLVGPKTAPMLLLHGNADTSVDYHQSVRMKEALDKAGVPNDLILIDGIGHVFSLQYWRGNPIPKTVRQRVFAFYDKYLKGLSEKQAEERFAALEAWEKAHPEAAFYGVSSAFDGKIKSCNKKALTAEFKNSENSFDFTETTLFSVEERTDSGLQDGQQAEIRGEQLADNSFLCRRVILLSDPRIGLIDGIRGMVRKTDTGWQLNCGRRGVFKLDVQPSTQFFNRRKGMRADLSSGSMIDFISAREYGDCRKIIALILQK